MNWKLLSILAALIFTTSIASAEVNTRTGAYSFSVTDVSADLSTGPEFTRIYNSGRLEPGILGPGWTTRYEDRIRIDNGALVLYDHCLKTDVRFTAADETSLKTASLSSIVQGAAFTSDQCGCQQIIRTEDGFIRTCNGRETDRFNDRGEMTRTGEDDNAAIVQRNDSGRITAIENRYGTRIDFAYNSDGLLTNLLSSGKPLQTFTYLFGELRIATATNGNEENYLYSHRGEMIGKRSGDKEESIWYYGDSGYRVKLLKEADGGFTKYSSDADPTDPLHTTVESVAYDQDGQEFSRTREDFFEKLTPAGSRWLARHETESKGRKSLTEYAKSGMPLTIESDDNKAIFTYDGKGRLIRKVSPFGMVVELAYDEHNGKITKVAKYAISTPENQSVTTFRYDGSGNLIVAERSDGQRADISYYPNSIISQLTTDGRSVKFEYNDMKKPVRIILEDTDEIRVSYNKDGTIEKIDSEHASTTLALTVASLFQKLLDLVSETKVSFTML